MVLDDIILIVLKTRREGTVEQKDMLRQLIMIIEMYSTVVQKKKLHKKQIINWHSTDDLLMYIQICFEGIQRSTVRNKIVNSRIIYS